MNTPLKTIVTLTRTALLLAPLVALYAGELSASPGNKPAFSWERVPRYMHIRKDTAFTAEEIRYLASFPLLMFEKSTGAKEYGSTEEGTLVAARAVKKISPATKVLYYRNVIVHCGGYAANAALTNMTGAFLDGRNGSDKLVRNQAPAYDLTNPKVRDWWLASAKRVCAEPSIDGLLLDGITKVLEPGYLRDEIGEKKKTGVAEGYTALMEEARRGFIIAFTAGLGEEESAEGTKNPRRTDEIRKALADVQSSTRRLQYRLAIFLICAEKQSYFCAHDGYDAKKSKAWLTQPPEFDRPLGAPKGLAIRKGYVYTREFAHASVRLDLETQTGNIDWR